ncbi:sulfatase family protein [Cyclobacterium jeungdonense]|uniref:Sulfatase n=1 Tax=Cyclobacterium jeungdonense TaxID=708087 RepID=A0ABT8C7X2_9BACT|nr:sulfatase [Cyclobacterium jeungdonense]MDN3688625.1 sulfatase [Cyclobacterium jeungdonense]
MEKQLIWLLFILGACSIISCNEKEKERKTRINKPPNIVFVLADQWRAQAVGYAGNSSVKTPNIDSLASESIVFHNAVAVLPVCAPWRGSFISGQYPLTHGLFYNDKPFRTETLTIGEILKKEGYQTGYIGKWHLNGHPRGTHPFSGRDQPVPKERREGFDYWKVREVGHNYNNSFYFDENDQRHEWEGYDAFTQTDSAISFIQKNADQPFLLVLSWGPPHAPYHTAPAEFRELYVPDEIQLRDNVPEHLRDSARQVMADYYAHCTALDKALGDLRQAIHAEGIDDNTIFVFTSEHGDMLFSKGVLKKQRPWDESIKVPMLIHYPDLLGMESFAVQDPINTPDILPTLLGLSGLEIPESVEGRDFSQALIQKQELGNEAALIMLPVPFHQWSFQNGGREYRGVRTKKYTYVKDLLGPWLLYDNEMDPFQMHNLVDLPAFEQLRNHLDRLLSEKLEATGDKFLPADEYMKQWNYLYDRDDSLRAENYLEIGR